MGIGPRISALLRLSLYTSYLCSLITLPRTVLQVLLAMVALRGVAT